MFEIDTNYVIELRREIHMHPEVDFDLPNTIGIIKRELDSLGIPYTEKYGEGSVVGYINPDKKDFTIGIRADTDALNMQERSGLPFASKIDGKMHACGHDAHTAMLLGAAKALKEMEDTLECRVLLIFQPSEEGMKSGAIMMLEHGLADEVDVFIGQHVDINYKAGSVAVLEGKVAASSRHFKITIEGKSAHAATAYTGIDALAIAVRIYNALQLVVTREIPPREPVICMVGKLDAGTAQNIVAERAEMVGTIRTMNMKIDEHINERLHKICNSIAEEMGAKITVHAPPKSACLYNNPYLVELARKSMAKAIGEENVGVAAAGMGSEDFSRMLLAKPGFMYRLGVRNDEKGYTIPVHHDDFILDEDALEVGAKVLVQFVVDNMSGIDRKKLDDAALKD